jgi:hypothetical protein
MQQLLPLHQPLLHHHHPHLMVPEETTTLQTLTPVSGPMQMAYSSAQEVSSFLFFYSTSDFQKEV